METVSTLTSRIFRIANEIESVEKQIIQLQLYKEELEERREHTRRKIADLEATQDMNNWQVGQKMTIDLLRNEVGGFE